MKMPCSRRNVRRLLLGIIALATIVISQIGTYGLWNWMIGKGIDVQPSSIDIAFRPLEKYIDWGMPGGNTLEDFGEWCFWGGMNEEFMSWPEYLAIDGELESRPADQETSPPHSIESMWMCPD